MEDMEDTENTVSMVMAEATVMDGEIVISILINLMPYLINDDGEFCFTARSEQLDHCSSLIILNVLK